MEFPKWVLHRSTSAGQRIRLASLVLAGLVIGFANVSFAATTQQKTFSSAEEAVKAAVAAARKNDHKELARILGPGSEKVLSSGDAVADKQRRMNFLNAYDEQNKLVQEREKLILVIGKDEWPFPLPVVKQQSGWVFDIAAGKEEILDRRIGENELNAIQVVLAYVDAQREYASKDHDGAGLLEYARRFRSDKGKKNGLYWEAKQEQEQSPLGPLFARAHKEGYAAKGGGGQIAGPYHGYVYKILEAQGKNAPGGAFSYLVKDKMIGGFALIAYPAQYGNSGVMTFIVSHAGRVFQKDLGKNTAALAAGMKEFNPDPTWKEVKE